MGQRLVISIRHRGEEVLSCYFHWSGYTLPAALKARNFMNRYACLCESIQQELGKDTPDAKSIALAAALEAWPGSGLCEIAGDDRAQIAKEERSLAEALGFDLSAIGGSRLSGNDRNAGLIAISQKERKANLDAAEYLVEIDISDDGRGKVTRFDPLWHDTYEDYEDNGGEATDFLTVKRPLRRFFEKPMAASDLSELMSLFEEAESNDLYAVGCEEERVILGEVA